MPKLSKDFFINNEVLFVGYSSRNKAFSKSIHDAFVNNGVKVYPYNTKVEGNYDVKVYHNLDEIAKMPATALVLLKKENTREAVKTLSQKGIKRIMFQSKSVVDPETLTSCKDMGIEAVVACPFMIFGKGLHRIHAFFAGVR